MKRSKKPADGKPAVTSEPEEETPVILRSETAPDGGRTIDGALALQAVGIGGALFCLIVWILRNVLHTF